MPKKNLSEIVCVLDRSGSMYSIINDAIGGFNAFLEEQQKVPGKANMSIILFDDKYDVLVDGVDIKDVKPFDTSTYVPRGSTALLDAVGRAIGNLASRITDLPKKSQPEHVIFVILTDGEENSSTECNLGDIKKLIDEKSAGVNGWKFMFLSAGKDAFAAGSSMGIPKHMTMSFNADSAGMAATYSAVTHNVTVARNGGNITDFKQK